MDNESKLTDVGERLSEEWALCLGMQLQHQLQEQGFKPTDTTNEYELDGMKVRLNVTQLPEDDDALPTGQYCPYLICTESFHSFKWVDSIGALGPALELMRST